MATRKVLIAINCMNIGGAPSVALAHLSMLERAGFEPWLLTLYPSKPANFLNDARRVVGASRVIEFRLAGRSPLDLVTLIRIYRFLALERFDTVITHLFLANLIVRALAVIVNVPRIISFEHSRYENKKVWQIIADRMLARYTYRIVVATKEIADFTSAQERIPRQAFTVIPNPVTAPPTDAARATDFRARWDIPHDRTIILAVGRFSDEKGHTHLVRAAERAYQREPRLLVLIVGHGARYEALATLARALDSVRIINDPLHARDAYQLADAFVLPSLREGESIATREALLADLPIVASDLPTLRAVLTDDAAILVPPGDESSLADALVHVGGDTMLRTRMSAAAHRLAARFANDAESRFIALLS